MPLYLFRFDNQPKFHWDLSKLSSLLGEMRYRQGRLLGKMEILGYPALIGPGATRDYQHLLTEEQLIKWHGGPWRNAGLTYISSVHASSPGTPVLRAEIRKFLNWLNADSGLDPVLKAAVAHLWLLVIQPFDQENERIAQVIADMQLSRADGRAERYYDMSAQIRADGATYDELVNKVRQGEVEITAWLEWFLDRLDRALAEAEQGIAGLVKKMRLTDKYAGAPLSDRQQLIIQHLMEAAEGRISSSQWANIAGCSQDTALRDIQDLLERSILVKESAGGRSTQYVLRQ